MSRRKAITEKHLVEKDYSQLTDDAEWLEVGASEPAQGKQAYIEYGKPGPQIASLRVVIDRMIEEGNTVVAEGRVTLTKKDGTTMKVQFCDLFDFEGERIRRKTSYAAEVK